jgi:CheY-like chemotaxis protein
MKRVLVVDDDVSVRNTVALILRRHGYEVAMAPDGSQCLELLRQGFKGVVLMDIMMPGMSGWDTIRAIVGDGLLDGILICMLTARATPGAEGQGLEEAVFDYLPKPFDDTALLGLVDNANTFLEA